MIMCLTRATRSNHKLVCGARPRGTRRVHISEWKRAIAIIHLWFHFVMLSRLTLAMSAPSRAVTAWLPAATLLVSFGSVVKY